MSSKAPRYSRLIVDEGDPAQSSGVLEQLEAEWYLLQGPVVVSAGEDVGLGAAVPLRVPPPIHEEARVMQGQMVQAIGTWDEGRLEIGSCAELTSISPQQERAAVTPAGSAGRASPIPLRPDDEKVLLREGALIELWQEGDRTYALATDTDRVREKLVPRYGESFVVLPSRWTEQTYAAFEDVFFNAPGAVLQSFGRRLDHDRQLRFAVTLRHLSSKLAHRLSELPDEALDLTVQVVPAASRAQVESSVAAT